MPGETTTRVTYSSDSTPTPQRFELFETVTADLPLSVQRLLARNPLARDLWWAAAACFAVDRGLKRPSARAWRQGKEWTRHIEIEIPVHKPEWWSGQAPLVQKILNWLTADDWSVRFVQDPTPPVRHALPIFDPTERIALFSGGLDSVSGLIDDLSTSSDSFRLVSVATNTRMRSVQKKVFTEVESLARNRITESSFLLQARIPYFEDTARTRGFVFLASGVITAIAENTNELRLYENGPGALNLALSRAQVGAQNARAVHPKTLRYMEQLARAITDDDDFRIVNRTFKLTKAEMIRRVPRCYDDALTASVSCDTGFSHHQGGGAAAHCGGCTSCVLRRQALAAANRDVRTPSRDVPKRKEEHLKLMTWQVARLRHVLRDGLDWERMVREFPDIVCDPESFLPGRREVLLSLFKEYAGEWDLPSVVQEFAEE